MTSEATPVVETEPDATAIDVWFHRFRIAITQRLPYYDWPDAPSLFWNDLLDDLKTRQATREEAQAASLTLRENPPALLSEFVPAFLAALHARRGADHVVRIEERECNNADLEIHPAAGSHREPIRTFKVCQNGLPLYVHEGPGLTLEAVAEDHIGPLVKDAKEYASGNIFDSVIFEGDRVAAVLRFWCDGRGHWRIMRFGDNWPFHTDDPFWDGNLDSPASLDIERMTGSELTAALEAHRKTVAVHYYGESADDQPEPETVEDTHPRYNADVIARRHRCVQLRDEADTLRGARERLAELDGMIGRARAYKDPALNELISLRHEAENCESMVSVRIVDAVWAVFGIENDAETWEPCGVKVGTGPTLYITVEPGLSGVPDCPDYISYAADCARVGVVDADNGLFEDLTERD